MAQHPPGTTFTMEAPTDSILGHVGGAQIDFGNSYNLMDDHLNAPSPERRAPQCRADNVDTNTNHPLVAGTNWHCPPANTNWPKYNKDYHCYIVGLMLFVDGAQYRMLASSHPTSWI
jgi:hypothetical protein